MEQVAAKTVDTGHDARTEEGTGEKWVQIASGAGMTCMMRGSVGDILAAPGGGEAILRFFDECRAVATAAGYPPRPAFIEHFRTVATTAGSPLKASMLRDIEHGFVTEGDHILGTLPRAPMPSGSRR